MQHDGRHGCHARCAATISSFHVIRAAMKNHRIAALLSFVAGFVDTAGFLGLQGHRACDGKFRYCSGLTASSPRCWRFRNSSWWSPWCDWPARP
jgi:hypothetical protein